MGFLWYCMDDTLAVHFNNPAIGTIPFWIPLIFEIISVTKYIESRIRES